MLRRVLSCYCTRTKSNFAFIIMFSYVLMQNHNTVHCSIKESELIHHICYIDVQNQVKYGGQMHFFLSRCFQKLLNTKDKKWFWHKRLTMDRSFSWAAPRNCDIWHVCNSRFIYKNDELT